MSSFKEFLNKNLVYVPAKQQSEWKEGERETPMINVNVFGDWAWEQFQRFNSRSDTFEYNQEVAVSNHGIPWCIYWGMVIDCFGEKEVRKRLGDLNE